MGRYEPSIYGINFSRMSPIFHILAFNYISRVVVGLQYLNTLDEHGLLLVQEENLSVVLKHFGIGQTDYSVSDTNIPTISKKVEVHCLILSDKIS